MREKMQKAEEEKKRREEEKKKKEEQEAENLRKSIKFKARPVPKYNFFEPKKANRPATKPQGPSLLQRLSTGKGQKDEINQENKENQINLSNAQNANIQDVKV